MSETTGQTGIRGTATAVVHESYAFACMKCGHGWEQSYAIEHHTDADGQEFVQYVADGRVVPSPLSRPACHNCDGHVVRIMRAGQVSSARDAVERLHRPVPQAPRVDAQARAEERHREQNHWHLSDLLHAFHRKAG
ncbi:hypothetical protein ACWD5V_19600 [Streptomyces sp. NPDC002523]